MKKILNFISDKKYFFMAALCVLLFSMTMKTQVVILKYGDEYSMRMEYSLYGYCVRASAALKATEPAVQNVIYFGKGMKTTVAEAVNQMELLADSKQKVGIMTSGYPRNNKKLEKQLEKHLNDLGYDVEILEVSFSDLLNKK